jgi:hypothetical protein
VVDDRFDPGHVIRRCLFVQVIHVDELGHRNIALGDGVEDVGFPAPVRTDEAVAASGVELEVRVRQELVPPNHDGKGDELQVPCLRLGGKDARHCTCGGRANLLSRQFPRVALLERVTSEGQKEQRNNARRHYRAHCNFHEIGRRWVGGTYPFDRADV